MVDVLRVFFTTAAYVFGAGAKHIYLVADVDEALAFNGLLIQAHSQWERTAGAVRPASDLSNSPVEAAAADLEEGWSCSGPRLALAG